jgi:hypothetical protein
LFEAAHPGKELIFVFDNSTNHGTRSEDALIVRKINMHPGGLQPLMREGWPIRDEEKVPQSMVMEDGKTAKGIKKILEERGLFRSGLNLSCKKAADHADDNNWLCTKASWIPARLLRGPIRMRY